MNKKYFFLFALFFILGGCNHSSDLIDLKSQIEKIKKMSPRKIEPLSEIKETQKFIYHSSDLRSPFAAPTVSALKNSILSNAKPDLYRKKHYLEEHDIDMFVMVGILKNHNETKGMVKVEDTLFLVSKGDYIGRNNGKIVKITEKAIHIKELVPSGASSWIERPPTTSFKLK